MASVLFRNARIFDGKSADCEEGMSVLVEGDRIREVARKLKAPKGAQSIDVGGRTLMPGLIDAHMHAYASDVNMFRVEAAGATYRAAHAVRMLGFMLDCGFTTVRDVGGGDYSLAKAIADGLVRAPRFLYSGKVLSMTGGHGDMRRVDELPQYHAMCSCGIFNSFAKIADGVDECIRATREELRQGAHCIKIMGSGGVASPTDPIWMNQYREDEIRAIVTECVERRSYASAHCHPASAIRRCVEFGVRSIEHGTLIDDETAKFVAKSKSYIVPTLSICYALVELGPKLGFPPESQVKAQYAYDRALAGLDKMRKAGVKVGYGTDLLGTTTVQQCREFTLRREVYKPVELLRQATSINAELMMMEGQIGCVAPDAYADLIVVDGDPLKDIGLLARDGRSLAAIMRGGELVKNALA
jgi:imidazolonepropionase-like amidohydrolase